MIDLPGHKREGWTLRNYLRPLATGALSESRARAILVQTSVQHPKGQTFLFPFVPFFPETTAIKDKSSISDRLAACIIGSADATMSTTLFEQDVRPYQLPTGILDSHLPATSLKRTFLFRSLCKQYLHSPRWNPPQFV